MEKAEYMLNMIRTLKIDITVAADTNIFKNEKTNYSGCTQAVLYSQLFNNLSVFLLNTWKIVKKKKKKFWSLFSSKSATNAMFYNERSHFLPTLL